MSWWSKIILLFIPVALATGIVQENAVIRYSGATGQTESFQPLGIGYEYNTTGVGVYCTAGGCNASTTIHLEECDDSGYTTNCSYVTQTPSFTTSSIDGNQESYSDWSAEYEMEIDKYYRLRWVSSNHRIQCGNDGDESPIDHSYATPSGACNAASGRIWTYHLYGEDISTSTATSTTDTTNIEIGAGILLFLLVFVIIKSIIRGR